MTPLQRYLTIYEPRVCLFCGHALHARMCKPLALVMADPEDELDPLPDDEPGPEVPGLDY